ncbi:MAG: SDR family oxidoreductase [Bacteroidota bacterium]|nr:SDR family oxidoreductase [Bacteroidota bacterium]MDP4232771.1 SDR family oxidoreductase [Bacteroidota bacterium]MDP4242547.1 SDR family oxidoreductase [Bacteroidota bacterium]MDP4288874.1 SDR family oxidoreductase [Bacteroidota bacterium]
MDTGLHEGRVVIVTGAAIGNGRAFAAEFARTGAQVVLGDIVEPIETVEHLRSIPGAREPLVIDLDVTSESSTRAMAAQVRERFGRIDILVNNAGIYDEEPFELLSLESWKQVMDVNLTGLFLATKAVLPSMKQQGYGRIINLSSNTIWLGTPYLVHYVTSKMGVVGFTRALASEIGKYGITVNAITIGLTATQRPPGARLTQGNILEHLLPPQSIEHPETPEDIARIVSFLASDASTIITGQTLNVDGGVARH